VRVPTDGYTDTLTDANRFHNLSMLYAIVMEQIKKRMKTIPTQCCRQLVGGLAVRTLHSADESPDNIINKNNNIDISDGRHDMPPAPFAMNWLQTTSTDLKKNFSNLF